jgi:hypothetical protein
VTVVTMNDDKEALVLPGEAVKPTKRWGIRHLMVFMGRDPSHRFPRKYKSLAIRMAE